MKNYFYTFIILHLLSCKSALSQSSQAQIVCIGFYNLENLFDTERDTSILDEEFTPQGAKEWTLDKYNAKLANLSMVIGDLGKPNCPDGPVLLGVSEVENKKVLEDLLRQKELLNSGYQILHYDSKDARGIDVALLYKPKYFKILASQSIPVFLVDSVNGSKFTRSVLLVKGSLAGQTIYITVNHWPSRRSGVATSKPYRNQLALLNYHLFDSIRSIESDPAFMVIGDLNDNPTDASVRVTLKAQAEAKYVDSSSFYNPFYKTYKNGEGSLEFNHTWSLFDQIILSFGLVNNKSTNFTYYQHQIYHKEFMIEQTGHNKNNPKRSFNGDTWNNGFSDHFPSLVYLIRNK
ncbi:MAG: endonuclease/exonuclease/phosphatase family protein [Saprospiraceae bacterium]